MLITLLAVESLLRLLAAPAVGGKEQRERDRYTQHDTVLGWRKLPGAAVRIERRDYASAFRLNARGLRGPEVPRERVAGVARLLALGDSFVEAFMVEDAATPTARLEAHLAGRGCTAEVVNGGTVGYSTDQEYLFFCDEGREYGADIVLLYVYHNDIPYLVLDENLGYPKPLLSFESSPPRVTNLPVPRYVPPPPAKPAPPAAPPRSHLAALVKDRLERSTPRAYNRLARLGLWAPLSRLGLNDELQLYRTPELGHLRPAWSAFTWTLQALAHEVARAQGRLVVVYVPSRMEVQDDVWELTQVRYELDPRLYDRHAVAQRIRYLAGRLRLPFVDLTAPLARAEGLLAPTYFPTDSHWNARGMDVAASALAGELLAARLIPGCR